MSEDTYEVPMNGRCSACHSYFQFPIEDALNPNKDLKCGACGHVISAKGRDKRSHTRPMFTEQEVLAAFPSEDAVFLWSSNRLRENGYRPNEFETRRWISNWLMAELAKKP